METAQVEWLKHGGIPRFCPFSPLQLYDLYAYPLKVKYVSVICVWVSKTSQSS